MCGIAGIIDIKGDREINRDALNRMTNALAHRGPDGEGFFVERGVGFGHRRLAVIDIEGGHQPMATSDGRGILTFNGEIYNYRELRRAMAQHGVHLQTQSDSEVLAAGLALDGAPFIERARGMFAFAWWDKARRRLLLARDRFGEKPLYYAETADGYFLFASELQALAASGMLTLRHSPEAIALYFHYGYVPDPATIYEGVFKLEAATTLEVAAGKAPAIRRYWRPNLMPRGAQGFDDSKSALLDRLDEAVKTQLVSDVPLGAFLSGGVDSSAIVSAMALSGANAETCTIGFDDTAHDDRAYARQTAGRYRAQAHEDTVSVDAAALIDKIARVYGEPFADPSAVPTYLVSEAARRHVKVALSGDGGDEIFGGYRRYPFFAGGERLRALAPLSLRRATFGLAGAAYPKLDWAPRPIRLKTTLQELGEDTFSAYARSVSMILPDRARRMLSRDFMRSIPDFDHVAPIHAAADRSLDPFSMAQAIDLATWLPGRMLTKVDRASMAHGLEVRAPFLDHEFAGWALSLPSSFRKGAGGKRILKAALEPRLDHDVLYRPKQGFSPPVANWLKNPKGPIQRLCQSARWLETRFFNEEEVGRMTVRHAAGVSDYSAELWALIMFDAFLAAEAH